MSSFYEFAASSDIAGLRLDLLSIVSEPILLFVKRKIVGAEASHVVTTLTLDNDIATSWALGNWSTAESQNQISWQPFNNEASVAMPTNNL
mmetsp:Transcript_35154/g.52489  ORF Transcript_35154/g.52489 Transcript_35154/m.52489 type:complete len:91 (+) Transcript_35154:123-395(+)